MAIKSMPVKVLQCFLTKGTKKFRIKGYKNRNLALQMKHIRRSIYSIGHVRVSDVTSHRRNISSFESRSIWRLFSFLETRCMLFSHAASYSDTLRLPAFQYSYPLAELRCGSLGRRKFQVGDFCEIESGGWWSRRFGRRWTRDRWHIGTGCRQIWKRHSCRFSCIGLDDHAQRHNPEVFIISRNTLIFRSHCSYSDLNRPITRVSKSMQNRQRFWAIWSTNLHHLCI